MGAVKNPKKVYTYKKCYDCLKELTLDAKVCFSCGNKVGPVDKNGIAKRPIDWKAYAVAFLAGLGFCYYMWWAFFQ
jgi:hypothetical protein